jgi:hypothetical protein
MLRGILLTGLIGGTNAGELMSQKFARWTQEFDKHYASEEERALAFQNFVHNDEMYIAHNVKGLSWTLDHNEFSDLTWEQFSRSRLGYVGVVEKKNVDYSLLNATNVAASLDWVQKGAVTPVKSQGQCGSCWTFSTTGVMEGAYFVAFGQLLSFSEQELTSCSDGGGNGCNGGLPTRALQWLETNALCLEKDYPYTSGGGVRGQCHACSGYVETGGVKEVPSGSETALLTALNIGPVAIGIEADKSAFQGYRGGVLNNPACGQQLDHAVLLVAYGTDSGQDYWKIKNSWGPRWGEDGYIRFIRGSNQCGVASDASYPTGLHKTTPGPTPPTPPSPTPGCHGTCNWNFDCQGAEKCWMDWSGNGCCGVNPPGDITPPNNVEGDPLCDICVGVVTPLLDQGGQSCPQICTGAMTGIGLAFGTAFCAPICQIVGDVACDHATPGDCATKWCTAIGQSHIIPFIEFCGSGSSEVSSSDVVV